MLAVMEHDNPCLGRISGEGVSGACMLLTGQLPQPGS